MAYADVLALKSYLGITATTDDALLGDLLDQATALVDRQTGTRFAVEADGTRHLDVAEDADDRTLYLREWLAAAPTSVTNGDGVAVAAGDYMLLPRDVFPAYALRLKGSADVSWTNGDDETGIAVVGRWGYSSAPPDDIVWICVRLAAYLYHQKDTGSDLDRPMLAGSALILPAKLPADIEKALHPYRWLAG